MPATIQTIQKPTKTRALDTSGNNNHGQIYSGRALEFDGVTDKLDCGTTFSETNHAICVWAKVVADTADKHIFDGRDANDDGIMIKFAPDETLSYQLNTHNVNTTLAGQFDNTWVRIVATYDGTTQSLYLNGVLFDSNTTSTTVSVTTNAKIGGKNFASGNLFNGMISDFQAWDTGFTADDALFDYQNPEQLALNRSGTSLTNSNLKLWYPMNDGHRGQQSFILDASNTGLGDDLVTNGDFSDTTSTDSSSSALAGWANGGASHNSANKATISNNECTIISDGTGTGIQQDIMTTGVTYKWSLNITASVSGGIKIQNEGYDTGSGMSDIGTHSGYFRALGNTFRVYRSGSCNITFDNVTLEPVNDKNHATTVFYGDMSDLLSSAQKTFFDDQLDDNDDLFDMGGTNGDGANTLLDSDGFVSDGSATATFGGDGAGEARLTNTSSAKGLVTLAVTTVVGRTYRAGGNISTTGNSDIRFSMGTSTSFNTGSQSGALTPNDDTSGESGDYVADDTTSFMQIQLESTTDTQYCEIDNFWVREVGTASGWTDADQQLDIPQTALQSYNQLAWFPGVDPGTDYDIQINDHSSIDDVWDSGGTLSAWIYPITTGASDYGRIFDKSTWLIYIKSESGGYCNIEYTFKTDGNDATGQSANRVVKMGAWNHVVVTNDASSPATQPKIYINGEEVTVTENSPEGSGTRTSDDGTNLFIGNRDDGARTFGGTITEVSFWSDSLNQSEINELYNDGKALDATTHSGSSNLVGYWRNNGLATWSDLSANSNNGTVNNLTETMLITAGADGSKDSQGFLMNRQRLTNSLNFKSDNNTATPFSAHYLKLYQNPLSNLTDDFSVSLWVNYHDDYTSFHTFLVLGESSTSHVHIGKEQGTEINISYEPGNGVTSRPRTSTGHLEQDGWTHVVVCFSTGTHTGSDNASVLTDSAANWTADELIDGWVHRLQSSTHNYVADITDNDGTTVTGSLDSGDYDTDDKYNIIKIYVNGSPVAVGGGANEDTGNPDTPNTSDSYYVGHSPIHNRAFIGQIDDLNIYSKWLTAAEVKRNYNAGKRRHR